MGFTSLDLPNGNAWGTRDLYSNTELTGVELNAVAQMKARFGASADPLAMEGQFPEANRMEAIGRLVGGVAHDFNNLLTGMVLCSELILTGLPADSRLRRFAEEIRSAGGQGAGLIHQLLAVARQRPIESRLLDLNQSIVEVRDLMARLIGENIEVVAELAPDLGLVEMDPTRVQQIIINLVLNARDAMLDGGRVVISTCNRAGTLHGRRRPNSQVGPWVEVAITDNGCGMDGETRARLFEPFFTTKQPGQGNGLGLATVHRIVAQQGGNIHVESRPGKGTRVVVQLPRAAVQSDLTKVQSVASDNTTQHSRIQPKRKSKSERSK
jgi:two-component system cell cycle sensor histidine kinase/response regulator CckA